MSKKKRGKVRFGAMGMGMVGFHLKINPPQGKTPPSAKVNQLFRQRGIPLDHSALQSLIQGRSQGIASLSTILGVTSPFLSESLRLKLATSLADYLMKKSITAQLSRTAPTPMERMKNQMSLLKHYGYKPAPGLLQQRFDITQGSIAEKLLRTLPTAGISLTVHF